MANVQMRGLQALLRWSWLFLSLYLISGCGGHKPQLNYNMTELVINEGEALEITCISVGDFKFYYPISDYYNKQIVVSDHTISEDEMEKSKTFRRPSTVVGDTGWYGCVDINKKMTDMTNKEYDDPTASWIYIYITSNTSAFVQSVWTSLNGFGCLGYQVIIPCRTTSPNFQVILKKNNKELRLGERITFDSKVGFVLSNSSRMDRGDYTCEVHQDSLSHKMEITFHSFHHCMGKLVIKKDDANPVTVGSTLKIKCAVTIKMENPYKYSWTTPQNSNSRTILVPVQEKINQFADSITSTFILHNVTYDDEGNYSCQVKSSFGENKSAKIYVYVYDPSNPFINLTNNDQNKIHINGSSVAFVAHVIAYLKPILRWIGPNGQQIESSYGYQIYYEESMSILEVHNVQKLDEGIYTLCAKNIIGEKILNFTLKVYDQPTVQFDAQSVKSYYSFNKNATFVCKTLSDSRSNLSWLYTECPKWQYSNDCKTLKLKSTETDEKMYNRTISVVTKNLVTFGKISCKACNSYTCKTVSHNICITNGVSDVSFEIIEPEIETFEGNYLTLVCAATLCKYRSVIWLDDKQELVTNSEYITVTSINTNFTYRSVLSIHNVSGLHTKHYRCKAVALDGGRNKFIVHSMNDKVPQKPVFTYVNMSDAVIKRLVKDHENPIYLSCYVKGTPKPSVTWYKNGVLLEPSEQFSLADGNQKLIIRYLLESDSGNYSCLAANRFGTEKKSQRIIVKDYKNQICAISLFLTTCIDNE